jgi:deoxyribodipyrimidine photolyase-like uncharacterized protein
MILGVIGIILILSSVAILAIPFTRRILYNLCIYILALDILSAKKLVNADYGRLITVCSENESRFAKRWLFKRNKKKMLAALCRIDRDNLRYLGNNVPYTRIETRAFRVCYANRYHIVCRDFLAVHPSSARTLENTMIALARTAPSEVVQFTAVCDKHIKAKCRMFNALARAKARSHMEDLATYLGRTRDIQTYLKY